MLKIYVKDTNNKTTSGVKIDIYDTSGTAIDSFISSNRFKAVELDNGEYVFNVSSAETIVDDITFKLKVGSVTRITETHPNVELTDNKLTIHVTEQVLTIVSPNDEVSDIVDDEPPMPEKIDKNNGPKNDRHDNLEQHVLNTSIQVPSRKPLPISISPTKNAKRSLYVGGLQVLELSGSGWFTVKYTNRGQGGLKTGYVKESDLRAYLK